MSQMAKHGCIIVHASQSSPTAFCCVVSPALFASVLTTAVLLLNHTSHFSPGCLVIGSSELMV